MERNYTEGNVLKSILIFSLPYLLSYFLQTLYGMADLFIVGQFEGAASTTAVSIGSQIMHMVTVMIVGLAMGSTVIIARNVGAKKQELIGKAIGNTISLFLIVSIVLCALCLVFTNSFVSIMSTPTKAIFGTKQYLMVCFIGIPCIVAYNIMASIFRGMGDSKSPMYFIAIACFINIVLDYLFIGYYHLGAIGAALATTLAQAISVIIAISALFRNKTMSFISRKDFKFDLQVVKDIIKIGLPISLQDGFIQCAFIVITIIANKRGLNDAAAVGIVEKVISFLFLVPSSMLSTVSALGAQNIGANKHQRVNQILKYALIITVSFGIIVSIIAQFIPNNIVSLFTNDSNVINSGGEYLRGYVFDCIFAGIHFSFSGYFCAYGMSHISFIHNIISILLARIPGVYITSKLFKHTLFPMGLATVLGSIISVIICVSYYIYMQRKRHLV